MRRPLLMASVALMAISVIAATAQVRPDIVKPLPPSLKTVPVPEPEGIGDFILDKQAAVALGKALFWDMQVGGDGMVACATCHFHAGADRRAVNQMNPGANGLFDVGAPNHSSIASEFPFHIVANPDDRGSQVLRSKDDVMGSQGVHASDFLDVSLGSARDEMTASGLDPLGFHTNGLNTRRVTGRNTPSAINAVFNIRNFWDGRANRRFNGRNPFGDADPDARVLMVNDLGEPEPVRISLDRASLASQAVGPPLSDIEMSGAGRTFMKLGKKMLTLTPLALQEVRVDDSVLGPMAVAGGKGITKTYAQMIREAFHERWWNSSAVVDADLQVVPGASVPADGAALPTDQYSMMEANFSLFWGLAIAAYEATLVSDDAPFDQWREGNTAALTPQQVFGLIVFMGGRLNQAGAGGLGGANCIACHFGAEFTGATFQTRLTPEGPGGPIIGVMERMIMGDATPAVYDGGFYNLGVRPTGEDIGLGANDPFGNPLSFARQEALNPGSVADNHLPTPVTPGERVTADGAFKTPSLRNVELTGPYFHNGSEASLEDVVQFYARGGNFHEQNLADLDFEMIRQPGLIGHPNRKAALVDFLRALTDERVRVSAAPFDHPELVLPNGATGGELSVLQDLRFGLQAADAVMTLPATGASGGAPAPSFLNVPVFDGTRVPTVNPTFSSIALFASDSINVNTSADVVGDVWSNGPIVISSRGKHSFAGDVTAGGNVLVSGDTTRFDGSIMARGFVELAPTTQFREGVAGSNIEYFTPLAQQELPAIPDLPLLARNVTVSAGAVETLPPGRYGTLNVLSGGQLVLQDGVYVVGKLNLGPNAFLQYDADGAIDFPIGPLGEMPIQPLERTILHLTDAAMLSRGAIISSGQALRSTHFKLFYHTTKSPFILPRDAFFHGTLVAPLAGVTLQQNTNTHGSIWAKSILVGEGAIFRPHELRGRDLPSARAAGPGGDAGCGPARDDGWQPGRRPGDRGGPGHPVRARPELAEPDQGRDAHHVRAAAGDRRAARGVRRRRSIGAHAAEGHDGPGRPHGAVGSLRRSRRPARERRVLLPPHGGS